MVFRTLRSTAKGFALLKPTTFEKVDKTFCFCPNEGDWLKEPDLRESEAFKFALNRLRETALVLSQKVPGSAC